MRATQLTLRKRHTIVVKKTIYIVNKMRQQYIIFTQYMQGYLFWQNRTAETGHISRVFTVIMHDIPTNSFFSWSSPVTHSFTRYVCEICARDVSMRWQSPCLLETRQAVSWVLKKCGVCSSRDQMREMCVSLGGQRQFNPVLWFWSLLFSEFKLPFQVN